MKKLLMSMLLCMSVFVFFGCSSNNAGVDENNQDAYENEIEDIDIEDEDTEGDEEDEGTNEEEGTGEDTQSESSTESEENTEQEAQPTQN